MCVICHAAKKRYMKRAEVVQAMKSNSAGFFGFTVHDGVRRTLRTLDEKQFLEFFDKVVEDDDMWVMHARIPSRGEKTVDNVHGWEQDGIIFCHNMTLSSLDGMMRYAKWEGTDSEFFFRHIFIPFYRGCGPEAYKDGKFCPDLDNLVRHFCGTVNKFLFIMPDNTVVRYGDWVEERDRKTDDGQVAFYASNGSYKVYEARWPRSPAVGFGVRDGYYGGGYYSHFNDGDWGDYDDDVPSPGSARTGPPAASDELKRKEELVELVRKTCGDAQLCRLALCDVVAHGAAAYRGLPGDWAPDGEDDDVSDYMYELMPDCFDDNTYDAAVRGFESLADAEPGSGAEEYTPASYAADYAAEFAENLVKAGAKQANGTGIVPLYPTARHVEAGLKLLSRQWRTFARIAGVAVDFSAKGAASFACVSENPERDGNRWKTNKVRTEDILVDETESPETTYKAVGRLLDFIREETAKEQERSLG